MPFNIYTVSLFEVDQGAVSSGSVIPTAPAVGSDYVPERDLSYDLAVIQWITSCYKNRTCNNTLARRRNVIDNLRVNNASSSCPF